jgi:hypothetical protein
MVASQMAADHPNNLVVAIASGYEPALAPDQLRHRASNPSYYLQRIAKMLA